MSGSCSGSPCRRSGYCLARKPRPRFPCSAILLRSYRQEKDQEVLAALRARGEKAAVPTLTGSRTQSANTTDPVAIVAMISPPRSSLLVPNSREVCARKLLLLVSFCLDGFVEK